MVGVNRNAVSSTIEAGSLRVTAIVAVGSAADADMISETIRSFATNNLTASLGVTVQSADLPVVAVTVVQVAPSLPPPILPELENPGTTALKTEEIVGISIGSVAFFCMYVTVAALYVWKRNEVHAFFAPYIESIRAKLPGLRSTQVVVAQPSFASVVENIADDDDTKVAPASSAASKAEAGMTTSAV